MDWIRFERWARFHAVLGTVWGTTYVTYCGRTHQVKSVKDATADPDARCKCCASRIQRPYLVPQELRTMVQVQP